MKLLGKIGAYAVLGIALSYAQPKPDDAGVPTPTTPARPTLSFDEMLTQSKAIADQIQLDWRHVKHLQETARKEKDVIKLNCVNDKLVQMKPQMNIADQAQLSLENSGDSEDRNSLYGEVTISGENIRRLREEADQCVGEPTLATESVTGFTAPEIPDNPFNDPFSPGDIEPPGYASPYN